MVLLMLFLDDCAWNQCYFLMQKVFACVWICKGVCVRALSCVWLFATPWTVAHQVPLFMEFSRQNYWSGLPFPPPGDLPYLEIEPEPLVSPELQVDFLSAAPLIQLCRCVYVIHTAWCCVSFYRPPAYKGAFSVAVKFTSPAHTPLRLED